MILPCSPFATTPSFCRSFPHFSASFLASVVTCSSVKSSFMTPYPWSWISGTLFLAAHSLDSCCIWNPSELNYTLELPGLLRILHFWQWIKKGIKRGRGRWRRGKTFLGDETLFCFTTLDVESQHQSSIERPGSSFCTRTNWKLKVSWHFMH